jgi:hypothetical protein
MKYFLDQEFIEGFHKPFLGKKRHYIDLVSIGIVCEDGREYEALSSEYNYGNASPWVIENVLFPTFRHYVTANHMLTPDEELFSVVSFHKDFGKKNAKIAQEIIKFIGDDREPIFYGYYSDYDWVLFCSLFGTMMDLPEHFPMYCRDLKQMQDERQETIRKEMNSKGFIIKNPMNYPKQSNEHNAISDARWNKELYDFLNGEYFKSDNI